MHRCPAPASQRDAAISTTIDSAFTSLPLATLADAALSWARRLGASHASFRVDRIRTARSLLHNGIPRGSQDDTEIGLAVWVLRDGAPGFATSPELTPAAATLAADQAMAVATATSALSRRAGEPVAEPVHPNETWSTPVRINPFEVPESERVARLAEWSGKLLAAAEVDQVLAKLVAVQENKYYADLAGTITTQQRVRVHPQFVVGGRDRHTGTAATLRSLGPPTARGWEYLDGEGWDWDAELAELPGHLAGRLRAVPVEPGAYAVLLDPSNLWLTIHETVGHATELDRVLGHEASYAGTTFVNQAGSLGALRYGSPLMNVTADRTSPHGLATTGFDDEGVAAQSWPLIEDGVLIGFQLDRRTAARIGAARSTGCAFAESAAHVPLSRMPNVSLCPAPDGPSTDELVADLGNGIYLVGADSFSVDTRRDHFQFTAQRAYRVHNGRLAGQLSGVAYQGRTTEFWSALRALGGASSYQVFGADLCGKGQPVQIAATSHGCPPALFEGVTVANP